MAFFLGIGGPWIILMVLDLFWTKQGLEPAPSAQQGGLQQRLEHLLRKREGRPVPIQDRTLLPRSAHARSAHGDGQPSPSEGYLSPNPN